MLTNLNVSLDNHILFRYLFFVLLFTVPCITEWVIDFNSLFVLTVMFLGLGFWQKSSLFLFLSSAFVVLIRTILGEEFENPFAVLIRLFIYLAVTFIASIVTRQYHEINKHKKELIMALAKSLDSRDPYTANHSEKVAHYAFKIAKEMNLNQKQCDAIFIGGLVHDIGKIGIPESILTKTSRLTNEEFESIKLHTTKGYEVIKHISSFRQDGISDMVLYHHERFDGKGYPKGLKGEEIPLSARILAVADTFDAMTSKRVYRDAMQLEHVLEEININKGRQFDPHIADVFLKILDREGIKIIISTDQEKNQGIAYDYKLHENTALI